MHDSFVSDCEIIFFGFESCPWRWLRIEGGIAPKCGLLQSEVLFKKTEMGFIEAFYSSKESHRSQNMLLLARSLLLSTLGIGGYLDIGEVSG